jgi:hypothetical protein
MTPEKTKEAFDAIAKIITEWAGTGLNQIESRLSEENMTKLVSNININAIINHLYFMTQEGKRLVDQGRTEKSMRWLGFAQGSLWGLGITSIAEQKDINRPNDVTYDAKRI